MRWKKGPKVPEKPTYWRKTFAFFPVALENSEEIVWLEWVYVHEDIHAGPGGIFYDCRYRDDIGPGSMNLTLKGS